MRADRRVSFGCAMRPFGSKEPAVTSDRPGRRVLFLAAAAIWCLAAAGPAAAAPAESCAAETFLTNQIRCFVDAAQAAGDPSVCETATDSTVRFQCLALYAERSGDPASCTRIEAGASERETNALRDSCVAGVAVANAAPDLCATVTTPSVRDACYLMSVTEAGAEAALCERIDNETLQRACREAAP